MKTCQRFELASFTASAAHLSTRASALNVRALAELHGSDSSLSEQLLNLLERQTSGSGALAGPASKSLSGHGNAGRGTHARCRGRSGGTGADNLAGALVAAGQRAETASSASSGRVGHDVGNASIQQSAIAHILVPAWAGDQLGAVGARRNEVAPSVRVAGRDRAAFLGQSQCDKQNEQLQKTRLEKQKLVHSCAVHNQRHGERPLAQPSREHHKK